MCIRDRVIGIINAIAVIGPRPGSIPIIVPEKQPIITIIKFLNDKAVCNPMSIPSIIPLFLYILRKDHVDKYLTSREEGT